MKFFNIDCHISVISDLKNILELIGHSVDHYSLSDHRWVFGFEEFKSPVINNRNWTSLNEKMVDDFFDFHKKDLDEYDAFICTHHIHFLKLFEKFNKPIIVIASTRYDYPFINYPERLNWLEDSLINNSNIIRIANNEFDKKYCEHFLNVEWEWIPSLCDYTGAIYNPTLSKSVLFSKFDIQRSGRIVHQNELGRYTWEDLYSYNSIIHLPYNVSTMSIFEQYQAGVPLNFPSLDFALELINSGVQLFSEIVFPNNLPDRNASNFLNKDWLKYSDFYNGTIKCHHFNSDFKIESKFKNPSNRDMIYEKWKNLLSKLNFNS